MIRTVWVQTKLYDFPVLIFENEIENISFSLSNFETRNIFSKHCSQNSRREISSQNFVLKNENEKKVEIFFNLNSCSD
jgi:hypothetical protein